MHYWFIATNDLNLTAIEANSRESAWTEADKIYPGGQAQKYGDLCETLTRIDESFADNRRPVDAGTEWRKDPFGA